jgi:glyoxylase-like metal-dependent hydrolase (beta-lactamase superfamily II)
MHFDRRGFTSALAAIILAPPFGRAAASTLPSDAGGRVERLAENVFAIIHEDATDEWPHSNVGFIVGTRSVFVIDSNYLPSRARADIALIRQITAKPVSHLATTHWHMDHNNGAIAYREAFPNVELIAERETARWLELNQTWWARMSTAPDSARRAAVAALEEALARGTGPDGIPFAPEERSRREDVIRRRQGELRELETLQVVTPDRLFDQRLSLDFEGTRIEIRNRGPANSPQDVTFWLPRPRILFAGDIVVKSPLPYTGSSWPVHWVPVLRAIEAVPIAQMVPGHGPVMNDHSYTRSVRALLEAALTRVETMIRAGRTLPQIQEALNLDDIRALVPEWSAASGEDWDFTRRTLAERAWVGLRGQGGR